MRGLRASSSRGETGPQRLTSFVRRWGAVQRRRTGKRPVHLFSILVCVGLVVAGCGSGDVDGFVFVAADDVGDDPFTPDVAEPVPVEFVEIQDVLDEVAEEAAPVVDVIRYTESELDPVEVRRDRVEAVVAAASAEGLPVIAPASPVGVGLYGGSGINACDLEGLKGFFAANPEEAAAFAGVQGINPTEINTFLDGLTAGFLLADTPVINHGFRDGEAYKIPTIMEAGTAVLVDSQGILRVRCICGNPLLPEATVIDGRLVDSTAFADRVVEAAIGADVPVEYPSTGGVYTNNPIEALGPPDQRAVSLGDDPDAGPDRCEFFLLVEFVDNRLIDGEGEDLKIVELGRAESSYVSVGTSEDDLRYVGEIEGGTTSFDISHVVEPGEEFSHVLICDGPDNTSEVPGSDIDAVAALNSIPADE